MLLQQSASGAAGSGVAVSAATHDVFVADTGNHRVDEFEANGTFVRAWGWEVNGLPGFGICTLTCQAGSSGSAPGQFTTPAFVAVDNSTGSSAGDVYVGDAADQLVSKFTPEGALVESWGVKGQLDGSKTPQGSFGQLAGVAVGATGVLEVLSEVNLLFEFEQDGTFVAPEVGVARGTSLLGLAVDAGGDFFKLNGDNSVEEFTGSGVDVGQVSPKAEEGQSGQGVATAGGDLYVADSNAVRHYVFSEPGRVVEPGATTCVFGPEAPCPASDSFGSSEPGGGELAAGTGIGVDTSTGNAASGNVYVADASTGRVDVYIPVVLPDVVTGGASEVRPRSVTLNGTVNPDGVAVTDCHFDYGTTTAYGQSAPCEQTVGSGTSPVPVTAKITGLQTGTTYHFRLQASNASGANLGGDQMLSTPPKPAISGESATNLTATEADLNALVNPGGHELTQCVFEYGTSSSYTSAVACAQTLAQIGSGTADVAVSQHITDLSPNTTYHWRVLATNPSGTTTGPDHSFVYGTAGEGLPDGRAYEMVTPVHKNAALFGDIAFAAQTTVAVDGSRVVLGTLQCPGDASACSVNKGGPAQYLFSRTGAGWTGTQMEPSAQQFETAAIELTNVDTGTALTGMPSPPNGQFDFYKRSATGAFSDIGPQTGDAAKGFPPSIFGATGDFSHFLFGREQHVLWPSFDETRRSSLYEYVGEGNSRPELVGVSGAAGSTDLLSTCATIAAGFGYPAAQANSLSADGRIAFFTPEVVPGESCRGSGANKEVEVAAAGVYARVDGAETVDLSVPSLAECSGVCLGSAAAGARFVGASLDGSRVLFMSTQQLTNSASEDSVDGSRNAPTCEATAENNGCNLYVATLALGDKEHKSRVTGLRALSAGDLSGHGPRVQGVMAVSNDGSRVYFVARGVLSATANDQGALARDGAENLYVSEGAGPARFIATLAEGEVDLQQWDGTGPANSTPDGRFLLFTSQAPLTRDDLRPVGGAAQVFRYDAVSGALVRVSVGESGFNDNGNAGVGGASLASAINARFFTAGGAARTGPSLSADGSRVFFMSPIGLTRGALNDVKVGVDRIQGVKPEYAQNVYEYRDGHVFLISDGRDANVLPQTACGSSIGSQISAVCLIGVDASGTNVFFSSADQLVAADTDTQLDVYDARICSAGDPCIAAPAASLAPCEGEACHGIPPARASSAAGPTATFNGAGNAPSVAAVKAKGKPLTRAQKLARALRVCRKKHDRRKRARCRAQALARYAPSHSRKASHKRGGR